MASVWSEGSPSCHMTVGDKRKQYMQVDGPEREELLSLTMLPLDVLHTILLQRGIAARELCARQHQQTHVEITNLLNSFVFLLV